MSNERPEAMQLITPADAAGRVTAALQGAAQATGAGFDYLLRTAKRESSLNPNAQAGTSSARGLFQFIDQTWLEVLKKEGPRLGFAEEAAHVSETNGGRYAVRDAARRAELLALRDDPDAAALLAGAFTQRNSAKMESAIGRAPTEGELYAAHFLGAQGASRLVTLASAKPEASAAAAFPAQAAANRAIFFDKGRARSAIEVYGKLTATSDVTAVAAVASPKAAVSPAATRATAPAGEEVAAYNNGVENDRTAFHSMFKTGRRSPVSAYVAQAWSAFEGAGRAADAVVTAPVGKAAANPPAYAATASAGLADTAAKASAISAVTTAATQVRTRAPKTALASMPVPAAGPPPSFDLIAFLRDKLSNLGPPSPATRGARP